ncbi:MULTISPECIES: sialate O-acetylesterase [unclassified Bradyrhizobium]|uniref:sialate O-acetylesterase n=1 Tax=unclassified Bradyrhizobium TaxID=2631580 RepID=UPI0028F0C449|nr:MULTISPECIES: sialate O-acetylesterase [unclassified Bradyrhizobium]
MSIVAGLGLVSLPATAGAAEVLPPRDVCQPTTAAKSRDGNCAACAVGAISTRPSFQALVAQVRARRAAFDDIDRRIDGASGDPEVQSLLKERKLAQALYGSDADFIAGGNASRCLLPDNEEARSAATPVPCNAIPRDGLVVLLTAGQSNISNGGAPDQGGKLYQPRHRFYNFNRFDGRCYVARNPLLGTTGDGENVATRLSDELIDRGLAKTVVIAPAAIGGTYVEEWRARGGKYFEVLLSTLAGLRDAGLEPSAVLWHQGESNAFAFSTNGAEDGTQLQVSATMKEAARLSYLRNDLEIIAGLRAADVTAPIFIAKATLCGSIPDEIIRSAQAAVPNPSLGVYPGPDTDQIGLPLRHDRCHMSRAGTELHAKMWADRLADYWKSAPRKP